ncbi:hypothetical protein N7497_012379 [Penicillium chrysogenum]|nr:hypothetical protein N7497_012379 [Penicillium chrysogenum]
MEPDIEIWDLDVVTAMYSNAILGQGGQDAEKTKKKQKKKVKADDEYHIDAVLALAANRQHRNLLASALADKTVKLWWQQTCVRWTPRHAGASTQTSSACAGTDHLNSFYVTTDGGMVYRYDMRRSPPPWPSPSPSGPAELHDPSVSSFDINRTIPGFLVTGSTDKTVKLWSVE